MGGVRGFSHSSSNYPKTLAVGDPFDGHATLGTDIVAYYKCDSNGSFPDSTGTYDGTINGADYSSSGKINGCYDYVETNGDYVVLSGSLGFNDGDNFSVSLWIKGDTLNDQEVPINDYDRNAGKGFKVLIYGGKVRGANIENGSNYTTIIGSSVSVDTWYHIVLSINGSTGATTLYVDNSKYNTNVGGGSVSQFNVSGRNYVIGSEAWYNSIASNRHFNGFIDEIGFWDKVLTDGEVSDLYNSGNGLSF